MFSAPPPPDLDPQKGYQRISWFEATKYCWRFLTALMALPVLSELTPEKKKHVLTQTEDTCPGSARQKAWCGTGQRPTQAGTFGWSPMQVMSGHVLLVEGSHGPRPLETSECAKITQHAASPASCRRKHRWPAGAPRPQATRCSGTLALKREKMNLW